jgi:hypothetical protein
MFGHQFSDFPHSFQNFSGTCQNVRYIFKTLAVEGDVLLQKPPLDPTPTHRTVPTRPLGLSRVWQDKKKVPEAGDFNLKTPSKPRSRNDFWKPFLDMTGVTRRHVIASWSSCRNEHGRGEPARDRAELIVECTHHTIWYTLPHEVNTLSTLRFKLIIICYIRKLLSEFYILIM